MSQTGQFLSHQGRLRLFCVAILIVVVGLVPTAYATYPDGTVYIAPDGLNSGGSNVWGIGDTVTYLVHCTVCDETCDAQFDPPPSPFTGGTGNGTSTSNPLTYTATATGGPYTLADPTSVGHCPTDASHGVAAAVDYKIVDIDYLSVNDQPVTNGATLFFQKATTGDISITATLTPDVASGELRPYFMVWTDGSGTDPLYKTVTRTSTGTHTIQCKAGPSGTPWKVYVVVFDVTADNSGRQLWYFNGYSPTGYSTLISYTVQGLGSHFGATDRTWTVTSGTDKITVGVIGFGSFGSTYSTFYNGIDVKSIGASTATDDVTIKLTVGTDDIWTGPLTVYAPQHCILTPSGSIVDDIVDGDGNSANPHKINPLLMNYPNDTGYVTWYYWTVTDMFSNLLPTNTEGNESFSTWVADYPGKNWPASTPTNIGMGTDGVSTFRDEHSAHGGGIPPCLTPWVSDGQGGLMLQSGYDTNVDHTGHYYKIGSSSIGLGRIVESHTLQRRRGSTLAP